MGGGVQKVNFKLCNILPLCVELRGNLMDEFINNVIFKQNRMLNIIYKFQQSIDASASHHASECQWYDVLLELHIKSTVSILMYSLKNVYIQNMY